MKGPVPELWPPWSDLSDRMYMGREPSWNPVHTAGTGDGDNPLLQGVCRWGMERLFTHALALGTPPGCGDSGGG